MRKLSAVLAVVAILCLGIFAAAAQAVEWAGNGYYLVSGQNGFLNHKVWLYVACHHGRATTSPAAWLRSSNNLKLDDRSSFVRRNGSLSAPALRGRPADEALDVPGPPQLRCRAHPRPPQA
jgi:hypothetical protein